MNTAHIKALGHYIPKSRLSNQDVLQKFQVDNAHILNPIDMEYALYGHNRKFEFLGLETRSFCDEHDHDTTIGMAVNACHMALETSYMAAHEIDCLIFCSVSNPFREPSFALVLGSQIGMESGDFFDINDTCNGFMKAIEIAQLYIQSGKYNNILIATSENPYETAQGFGITYAVKDIEDVDNGFSALLVGCGAAALVLTSNGTEKEIIHYAEKKQSKQWDASLFTLPTVSIPHEHVFEKSNGFYSNARLISGQIIKEMPNFIVKTLADCSVTPESIDLFILHQLGNNVTFALLDILSVPHSKAPINTFQYCGNMACANIPINLSIACQQGTIKSNDLIVLVSSACGLSYSLILIKW